MAKRYHTAALKTVKDLNEYVIEIHDTDFVDTSVEFTPGSDIFTLSWTGEMRKSPVFVQPSEISFQFNVTSAAHDAIIDDLSGAQEGRFQIKVFKNGNFHWCGNVVVDNSHRPDLATGLYAIEIRATDMLGALANVDYNDDGDPYTGTDTLVGIIQKCLSKTGLLEFGWGASDVCIRTADNWYEDSMPTGTANDPLALSRTRHRAFYNIDQKGKRTYLDCLKVLEQVLQLKNCMIKLSAGAWRVYQYGELVGATLTAERRYDRDGVYLGSTAAVDVTKTLDQDESSAAKENIVDFGWYPPFKQVDVTYRAQNWLNYWAGSSWDHTSNATWAGDGVEINHISNLTKVGFHFELSGSLVNNGFGTDTPEPHFAIFQLQLKIGDNYLRRDLLSTSNFQATYGQAQWWPSPTYYNVAVLFYAPASGNTGSWGAFSIDDLSPTLSSSGTMEATIDFVSLRDASSGSTVGALLYDMQWYCKNQELRVYTNNLPALDISDILYVAFAANANVVTDKLILESIMGDGTTENSQGRIEVYNGSSWEDSDGWQVGGSGTELPLLSLLAKYIISYRKLPVIRMTGDIYDTSGTMAAHSRIDDNSSDAIWLMVQASHNARMERWTGDWFYIADSPTDITVAVGEPIEPTKDPITGGGGGSFSVNNPTGFGATVPSVPGVSTGNIVSSASTDNLIPSGAVTTITTSQTLNGGAFVKDQVITVVNPLTGFTQNFTVTADTVAGSSSIAVSGYAADDFPAGSFIVVSPQNGTVQGFGSGSSSGAASSTQTSNWWEIFQQWWEVDEDLDINWPIEGENIAIETDPNAGDGATSGFRMDGDGLQSFDSSNTTPGVKIGLAGKLELNNLDTGTGTDGLIVEGGVVKKKTLSAGVSDHGALTGLADDDHTQYHNDARGDARYYTETELDAGQLDNRYFTESEHISTSAGAGDAGKPIKLDAAGHVDATMINDGDIDHGSIGGLADDDHTQYHNDTRGDARYYTKTLLDAGQLDNRYYTESEHLNSSAGAGDAGKPIKLDAAGHVDATMINDGDIDHGSIGGLADDDHTQYHNDTRGDARYYTKTLLDAGQLDNRYFTESEHLSSSAGAGDAGKPIKLDAAGHVDATMINDGDIDHGSIGGLGDDDHTQYHNDTRGDARYYTKTLLNAGQLDNRYFRENEHLNSSAGAGDAGKPIKLDAAGHVDATMINDGDIDHGSIGGLSDDDHTQYTLLAGRAGGQSLKGGTASGEDLDIESTSNATKGSVIIHELYADDNFDIRTATNAGNGSTAGITFDETDGLQSFASTSATPKVQLLPNGLFYLRTDPSVGNGSTAGVLVFGNGIYVYPSTSANPDFSLDSNGIWKVDYASHPTAVADLVYIKSGILHTNTNNSERTPNFGHILRFQLVDYATDWATGTQGVFWRCNSEFAGYQVARITYGLGTTSGSGGGNNTIVTKMYDHSLLGNVTIDTTNMNSWPGTTAVDVTSTTLAVNDAIWWDITAVNTTPAKGLMVELYLKKS